MKAIDRIPNACGQASLTNKLLMHNLTLYDGAFAFMKKLAGLFVKL